MVARFLSMLRSHEMVSSVFWLLSSDLCEERTVSVVEYLSSMVASLESINQSVDLRRGELDIRSMLEMNSKRGKFNVRFKRRNGRVKITTETFHVRKSGIKFTTILASDGGMGGSQDILPKLQFNLQLSEKEREDRAQVVLPFEHQGMGKPIQIYDGRKSQLEGKESDNLIASDKIVANGKAVRKGEIIYFRDSDDEMPDSDEDPDDDLDI
uniref:Elongator complex protein 5 n=1 Tax=Kalanchoe fedtschenkoi TaxID=63787 RepID=A0A7N0RC38_KALFE